MADETHLKSLIRAILSEDGYLKRSDSEQTIENSLQPTIPSPSVDPFTTHWYATLVPHKTRHPFKAPETYPKFFHVRDAQHTALFNPHTPAGGCQEADLLYQAIAFLHRALDDLVPIIGGQQLFDVWKTVKGVAEMLHTRYDLICSLRRSRDDQHIRYLEMFMQPPSGDGAVSAKIHREICRAVSKKRPREDMKDSDGPPQARLKTSLDMESTDDDQIPVVTPVKNDPSPQDKKPITKDIEVVEAKSQSTPTQKAVSRSNTVGNASKSKRVTPAKTNSSRTISRTRSGDVSKRLRSNSISRDKLGTSDTKTGKPTPSSKKRDTASSKKNSPKKQPAVRKKASSNKKVEPEKKSITDKPDAVDKNITPNKQRSSTKLQSSTSGTPKKAPGDKKVTVNEKVISGKDEAPSTLSRPVKRASSIKKSNPHRKAPFQHEPSPEKAEKGACEQTKADDNIDPNSRVGNATVTNVHTDEEVELVYVKMSRDKVPNGEKNGATTNSAALTIESGDTPNPSAVHPVTNFSCVVRGDSNEEMKSSLHTYAGYQWQLIVYPSGDNHKDWMSVHLECQGPATSKTSNFEKEKRVATEAGEESAEQAWFIRVKFSVRVLRTDSAVTKAVLEGKDVTVDNDLEILSASKVDPDGKVAQAGLLSDFVGVISHDFSSLSDRVGFSRLAPTSCLNPGMYADDAKNIVLMLLMCAE